MKKFLTVLCVALLVVALGVSASAADAEPDLITGMEDLSTEESVKEIRARFLAAGYTEMSPSEESIAAQSDIPDEVTALAYQSLEDADEETKAAILDARAQIINSYSWSDGEHGVVAFISSPENKEFRIAPFFRDLFPADWEPPVDPEAAAAMAALADKEEEMAAEARIALAAYETTEEIVNETFSKVIEPRLTEQAVYFNGDFYLEKAGSVNASVFCSTSIVGEGFNYIREKASNPRNGTTTFNAGLNGPSGNSIAVFENIEMGVSASFRVECGTYSRVGCRASTHSTPGTVNMSVTKVY